MILINMNGDKKNYDEFCLLLWEWGTYLQILGHLVNRDYEYEIYGLE